MEDYLEDGWIVQRFKDGTYNAVDACFLNSNMMAWEEFIEDDEFITCLDADEFEDAFTFFQPCIRRFHKNENFTEESKIWTDTRTVSRDNTLGALVLLKNTDFAKSYFWKMVRRFGFYQNTRTTKGKRKIPDLALFESWSILYRCAGYKNRLVIWVLDFFWYLSALVFIYNNKNDPNYNSVLPHMLSALILFKDAPTYWSRRSQALILDKTRHVDGYMHKEPVVSSLMEYSRADYDPPIYDMAAKVIEKLRGE